MPTLNRVPARILRCVSVVALASAAIAQPTGYNGHKVVQIAISDEVELAEPH